MTSKTDTGTRAGAVARARAYVEKGAFEDEIARRVAFKTESQKLPASLPELHRYLTEEMAPAFAKLGFTTRIYENPLPGQAPVLLATYIEDPAVPTVLGYGHGDVIRGLEDQWTKGKGPWITARDGERLYGRGTADNKGQHTINMAALDAVRRERGGRLGFNAKFMIEMGEEAGSKGLA
jgi:acetylornithine deacetylase/succinyl-diaminopimelate desuccinylase-like protein